MARVLAACLSLKRQNTRVKGTINITMESPNVTGSPLSFSTTHPPLSQRTQTLNKPPHQSGKGRSNKFDPACAVKSTTKVQEQEKEASPFTRRNSIVLLPHPGAERSKPCPSQKRRNANSEETAQLGLTFGPGRGMNPQGCPASL